VKCSITAGWTHPGQVAHGSLVQTPVMLSLVRELRFNYQAPGCAWVRMSRIPTPRTSSKAEEINVWLAGKSSLASFSYQNSIVHGIRRRQIQHLTYGGSSQYASIFKRSIIPASAAPC
jgi:hypothetical protein